MFYREMKINFKKLIIWTSIMLFIFLIVFLIYPSIMENTDADMMSELMAIFPPEVLEAFNMDIEGIDSAFGWFKTEGYVFLALLGGIYAATLGATILVKEESDKTIEFLYAKPVSRNQIVTSKILCGVLNIFIFTSIITIFNYIGFMMSGEFDVKQYFMIAVLPLLLYLMLFFICLFISTFFKKTKQVTGLGIGIVFLSYIFQIIGGMSNNIEILKKISLFEFVSSRYVIINDSYDMKYIWIGMGIIIVSVIGAYSNYNKKELT